MSVSWAGNTWQCPANQTNSQLQRVTALTFLPMDRYRGYKPAWMAMEPYYRSTLLDWNTETTRQSYLDNGNAYLDPYMYHERLRVLLEQYGSDIELWQIASTHFGFPVYAILIGSSQDIKKPAIMHVSALHGNEMIGVNYALDGIDLLLTDEKYADFRQQFNIWFVPMANPDGNWLSMRRAHASTYGKGNGRNTDGTCECFAYEGIDLCDNFPDRYQLQLEDQPTIEPETQGLMNLMAQAPFVAFLSLHTGGEKWYTIPERVDVEIEEELIQSFNTDMRQALNGLEIQSLRADSNLHESIWFYQQYGFPSFIYEYPSDIAPMEHAARQEARDKTQEVLDAFWNSLLGKSYVKGQVVNQEGTPISASLHMPKSLRHELVWNTSEEGDFALMFPMKEVISLQVKSEGYTDAIKKIDLRSGKSEVVIVLSKSNE